MLFRLHRAPELDYHRGDFPHWKSGAGPVRREVCRAGLVFGGRSSPSGRNENAPRGFALARRGSHPVRHGNRRPKSNPRPDRTQHERVIAYLHARRGRGTDPLRGSHDPHLLSRSRRGNTAGFLSANSPFDACVPLLAEGYSVSLASISVDCRRRAPQGRRERRRAHSDREVIAIVPIRKAA